MRGISAEEALALWKDAGLLTKPQTDKLRAHLQKRGGTVHANRGLAVFATLGALLIGLGVLLFIGSNWSEMSPMERIGVLWLGYVAIVAAAYGMEKKLYPRVAEALWFLATLLFGANIFLQAQIFHFSVTYWQGPFLWLIGALAMGLARRHWGYACLAVPLILFTVGWIGGGSGWFFDDQFEFLQSEAGLAPMFPILGFAFLALGLLARKSPWTRFAAENWIYWALLFISVPLVISTFSDDLAGDIFRMAFTHKQIIICIVTAVALLAAAVWGKTGSLIARIAMPLAACLLIPLYIPGEHTYDTWLGAIIQKQDVAFALYVFAVFCLSVVTMWVGVSAQSARLINFGIAGSAIIIVGQYFSWSFLLLDRSIAFIVGGLVILVLSVGIERFRRQLVSRVRS